MYGSVPACMHDPLRTCLLPSTCVQAPKPLWSSFWLSNRQLEDQIWSKVDAKMCNVMNNYINILI